MTASLTLFRRLVLRAVFADLARTALTIFAVALGVAVVIAIELAGVAAAGSFRSSVESLTGSRDLEITAIGGLDEQELGKLARLPYPAAFEPRIDDFAVVEKTGAIVPLAGRDLIGQRLELHRARPEATAFFEWLRDPRSVWTGAALGYSAGDRIRLTINDRSGEYEVRGVLPGSAGTERLIVMDIGAAQRALGRQGRVDRIDVAVNRLASAEEWIGRLCEVLPADAVIRRQGARTVENEKMLAAFRWNLRVLSYIALVVGAFLIYNTIAISVVRRRPEIGVLRALGATRGQVIGAFLAEAAFFGLAGGAAGVVLGRLLAEGAVGTLSSTVESLYVSSAPAAIALTPAISALGLLIGISVALVSALAPAFEAARVAPVEAMARGRRDYESRVHTRRNLWIAAGVVTAATAASAAPPVANKPIFGYAAALLFIAAGALVIPAAITSLSRMWQPALKRYLGVEALLASRSLASSLARTSVLVGALATAVAMMGSVGIMVGSFRETVSLWLESQLKADFYVRPVGSDAADRNPTLSPELAGVLESVAGVAAVDRFRLYDISYKGRPALLGAGQSEHVLNYGRTSFLPGQNRTAILKELPRGDNVIVSEPFANKHGIKPGQRITLPLGGEERGFEVLGVYRDFSNERGYIIMDRATLLKYLPDEAPSSLAVFLKPGVDIEAALQRLDEAAAGHQVVIFTNRSLRAEAMGIFDRTFAVTYALEAVAVAVAVMGIAGALLALVIDRRREIAMLRFLGAAAGQVRRLIFFEAGLLGLLANLIGLALGFVLSLVLIFVINKQSFGWTIEFHLPVALLLGGLTAVYAATLAAALYPARVATSLNPIEVIHEE